MWIRRLAAMAALLAIGLVFLSVSGVTDPSKSADKPEGKKEFNWLRYDEGLKQASKNDKLVFIDVYTNWCGFCKKMDRETFSDKMIMNYLDEHFVMVKLNAESKEKMVLPGGSLSGRQVARSFAVRGYPTFVFLNSNGDKIYARSGYHPPNSFIYLLRYVADGHYESKSLREYITEVSSN
jgi:thioredoxin-related protein